MRVPEVPSGAAEHADRLAARLDLGPEPDLADFTPPLDVVVEQAARTVVVVGGPGSGKTALTVAYVHEVARRRQPGGPVAVRVDLATWTAGTPVRAWLVRLLRSRHRLRRDAAEAVLAAGLLHPVVDGVDELAPDLRPGFLAEVAALPFPVLLTSRLPAPDLPVLALTPVPLHATLHRRPSVAEAVRDDPSGPVATAFADPVNRYLLDKAHTDGAGDPPALVDPAVFPDAESIGRHLLADADSSVRRNLHSLADLFRRDGEGGVAWWRVGDRYPRWAVRAAVLVVAVIAGLVTQDDATAWVRRATGLDPASPWWAGGVVAVLVAGALLWASRPRPPRRIDRELLSSKAAALAVVGVALVVTSAFLDPGQVWSKAAETLGVGLVLAWLWVVSTPVDVRRMDAPSRVLLHDGLVAALWMVLWSLGFVALLQFDQVNRGALLVAIVIGGLAASGSSCNRLIAGTYARSGSFVDFVAAMRIPELVRREGGVLHLRTEAVRQALEDSRFEQVGPRSAGSPAAQVIELRHELAEEACRRDDVRSLVDAATYKDFVARIAEDVRTATGVIVPTASTARSRYEQAKDDYARALLRLPLDAAERVNALAWVVGSVGWSMASGTVVVLLLQSLGLTALPTAIVAVGAALALSLLVEARQWRGIAREAAALAALGVSIGSSVWFFRLWADVKGLVPWPAVLTAIGAGTLAGLLFLATRTYRASVVGLRSDDPQRWPADAVARARAARGSAVDARRAWVDVLVERGVRPLVGARLASVAERSYAVELPPGDVRRLGQLTDVAQFVATETSRHLADLMKAMSGGAIGVSGPRGVGKSTVLAMFGRFDTDVHLDATRVVVPAPTHYAPRDFLAYLYAGLCEEVLRDPRTPPDRNRSRTRKWPWLVVSLVGALVAVGAWQVEHLVTAAAWVPEHLRALVIGAGVVVALAPLAVLRVAARRAGHPDDEVVREARRRLDGIRYVETATVTRTATAKPPAVAEFGGSHARARAGQVKTFPELVGEFRSFLALLTGRRGTPVVVCVDELDKIGSTDEAERFLNDIKAVFGVEDCFFLVAVSDDALASYSRRSSTVRTAFDSAFDVVVGVRRFVVADTRRLLVRRVAQLPEPFVWLCHALSGGLPRDLNRVVRELYVHHASTGDRHLAELTRALVRTDLETVVDGLSSRLADRFDPFAVRLRRHLVAARRLEPTVRALRSHPSLPTPEDAPDDLLMVHEQLRAYLVYAATVLQVFGDRVDRVVAALAGTGAEEVEFLALARTHLATDPVAAVAYVDDWKGFEERATVRPPRLGTTARGGADR
ncbi:hypothetical protein AB0I60_36935 [Actinosynnema sp. NPDC050436]|uniref:hypothetical protein n=1 Tax=Actinosynnema sp. NPDC050436 TaxID=3155659 RepID=UPI0033EFE950